MAFKDFSGVEQGVQLLQRSLECGRLAHSYLFSGSRTSELENLGMTLAKTLNCLEPVRSASGAPIDCCDKCLNCRRIEGCNHPDVYWVRPESKSRVIVIDQMKELMRDIHLKPSEAEYKVAIIVAADRLNVQAANSFLKTLEEPPPNSVLILLTSDTERILETILSRCLRLNFGGEGVIQLDPGRREWLGAFAASAGASQKSLLGRYRLLDQLLSTLNSMRESIKESLSQRSPLQSHPEADESLREKWEDELSAAIEAEYRRQRSELLMLLQWWLRDVWVETLSRDQAGHEKQAQRTGKLPLGLPELPGTKQVADRITVEQALENLTVMERLQRLLHTNVQEALALEVHFLKLHL